MAKPKNKLVKNTKSPKDEKDRIAAYKKKNPKAEKKDNLDVSAVVTKDGEKGHALLKPEHNRSKDRKYHQGKDFIPDDELPKKKKKK